jgi:hypothetical protein
MYYSHDFVHVGFIGDESYDRKKAWSSINHPILSVPMLPHDSFAVIIQPAQSLKNFKTNAILCRSLTSLLLQQLSTPGKKLLFCRINALPFPHRKYLTFFCRKGKHAGQEGKKSCFAFLYTFSGKGWGGGGRVDEARLR